MPQPLIEIAPDARYRFTNFALQKRPEHSALIMGIIGSGSCIETSYGMSVPHYTDDPKHIATILNEKKFRNMRPSLEELLQQLAKEKLSNNRLEIFLAAIKSCRQARDLRSDFAHGLWGYTEDRQEYVLLMKQVHARHFEYDKLRLKKGEIDVSEYVEYLKSGLYRDKPRFPIKFVIAYGIQELERIQEEFATINVIAHELRKLFGDGDEQSHAEAWLSNHPVIRAHMP